MACRRNAVHIYGRAEHRKRSIAERHTTGKHGIYPTSSLVRSPPARVWGSAGPDRALALLKPARPTRSLRKARGTEIETRRSRTSHHCIVAARSLPHRAHLHISPYGLDLQYSGNASYPAPARTSAPLPPLPVPAPLPGHPPPLARQGKPPARMIVDTRAGRSPTSVRALASKTKLAAAAAAIRQAPILHARIAAAARPPAKKPPPGWTIHNPMHKLVRTYACPSPSPAKPLLPELHNPAHTSPARADTQHRCPAKQRSWTTPLGAVGGSGGRTQFTVCDDVSAVVAREGAR
ncbi:hypothetical protein DFH06DRAFT_1360028 [Mycena polygramma]|nr:hypothetical protein DFH06DRAFT_1360028 [Mycena polygramma]